MITEPSSVDAAAASTDWTVVVDAVAAAVAAAVEAEDVVSLNGVEEVVVFVGVDVGDAGSEAPELDLEAVVRRLRGVMTLTVPETRANETRRGEEEEEGEEASAESTGVCPRGS